MSVLINEKIDNLLKNTSVILSNAQVSAKKVRGQIGLLYLLARVADIADSKHGNTQDLLNCLKDYNQVAQGNSSKLPDFTD